MRILLYTGKGGVGKTSVSASTAIRCADLGYKTLVLSTDGAHSLSDSLDVQLSGRARKVTKNLHGLEINIQQEMDTHWAEIEKYVIDFFTSQGFDEITSKEMVAIPGMEMLFGLFHLKRLYDRKSYDVVVVDTAPTADTLRLLMIPDAVDWYMRKFFKWGKRTVKTVQHTWGRFMGMPFPKEGVYKNVQELYEKLKATREILVNPEITSIRLVCNPERMVVNETQRAFNYLGLFGFPVDSIAVNRVMPDSVHDEYFKKYMKLQKEYLKIINDTFSPVPIIQAPLLDTEVVGLKRLRDLATEFYGTDGDPTTVFNKEIPLKVYDEDEFHILSIKMPYVKKEELDIFTRGDELFITVGGFKRAIVLPRGLAYSEPAGAEFKRGRLIVKFKR